MHHYSTELLGRDISRLMNRPPLWVMIPDRVWEHVRRLTVWNAQVHTPMPPFVIESQKRSMIAATVKFGSLDGRQQAHLHYQTLESMSYQFFTDFLYLDQVPMWDLAEVYTIVHMREVARQRRTSFYNLMNKPTGVGMYTFDVFMLSEFARRMLWQQD